MKTSTQFTASLLSLLIFTCLSNAQVLRVSFSDGTNEDFMNIFNGDIGSVSVTINQDMGSYTVDWYASSPSFSFIGPMRFELSLFNERTGDLIILAGDLDPDTTADHFIHGEDGVGNLFAGWMEGDVLSTAGSLDGEGQSTVYLSGIYSPNCLTAACDTIEARAALVADPVIPSEPELDSDGDGVADLGQDGLPLDQCPDSDIRPTVFFLGENTWIPNQIDGLMATSNGYTLADLIRVLHEDAEASSRGLHGQYVQHMVRNLKLLVKDGLLTQAESVGLVRMVARNK